MLRISGSIGMTWPGKVGAVAALGGFQVQRRAGFDEVRHVRDVHAEFPVAVVELLQADRVVVVLGVRRIDRDDRLVGQIETSMRFVFRIERIDRVARLLLHARRETRPAG